MFYSCYYHGQVQGEEVRFHCEDCGYEFVTCEKCCNERGDEGQMRFIFGGKIQERLVATGVRNAQHGYVYGQCWSCWQETKKIEVINQTRKQRGLADFPIPNVRMLKRGNKPDGFRPKIVWLGNGKFRTFTEHVKKQFETDKKSHENEGFPFSKKLEDYF